MWVTNSSGMDPPWPMAVSFEVVFEADLPNGPYAEGAGSSHAKLMLNAGSDANTMGRAALDAMAEAHSYDQTTAANMRVVHIKFKGGDLQPGQAVQEGPHSVMMGVIGGSLFSSDRTQSVQKVKRPMGADMWVPNADGMRSPWPATFSIEVVFEANLPNGPYANWTGESSAKLTMPPNSDVTVLGRGTLDALAERHAYDESTVERMRIVEIKYKGGLVKPGQIGGSGCEIVKEGVYQVKLGCLEPALNERCTCTVL